MAEHKYAQVLRWLADGKEVVGTPPGGTVEYQFPTHFNMPSVIDVVTGVGGYTFRLKPRTITIGRVECEAPVLEPEEGQTLYWINQDYQVDSNTYRKEDHRHWVSPLQHGDCFATPEAAWAARNAITKLLTGSAS